MSSCAVGHRWPCQSPLQVHPTDFRWTLPESLAEPFSHRGHNGGGMVEVLDVRDSKEHPAASVDLNTRHQYLLDLFCL